MRALCLLLLGLHLTTASPFDPHEPPRPSSRPFFDGWFTRVVDHTKGLSFAVIFGSLQPGHSSAYNSSWVALLYAGANSTSVVTEQHFLEQAEVRIAPRSSPSLGAASSFTWRSALGSLAVEDGAAVLDFRFEALRLRAQLSHRVPWSSAAPDSAGPEGWAARLPPELLPCHYYVHSLASRVSYTVELAAGGGPLSGDGFGHMETNYGQRFPDAWIWAEGIGESGLEQLAFTSGKLQLSSPGKVDVLAYRSRQRAWDLRNIDADLFRVSFDSEAGWVRVVARRALPDQELHLNMTASPGSFSEPLFSPTSKGWSNDPGSVESYAARASVAAYEDGVKVEEVVIPLAALEFGGAFRGNAPAGASRSVGALLV